MKIRTVYFKVSDIERASAFWSGFLGLEPHKTFEIWHEFVVNGTRLGLLLNDMGDGFTGSGCVPVFEFPDDEIPAYIARAKSLGATVVADGLEDANMRSIVFATPDGHEFEITKHHD
ncbi:MAG: VOC family protein [Micavibrio sp.]|nr:VOC family protein [Micavibrio sp.]